VSFAGRWLWLLGVMVPATAAAQAGSGAGRWEIEVHGGVGMERNATDGSGALPPPGEAFQSVVGVPSRRASTWYFGDGALLLNQINGSFAAVGAPTSGRITPLDPVLQAAGGTRSPSAGLGVRVGAAITRRFGVEFTLDAPVAQLKFTDGLAAGVEASRASFLAAWNASTGVVASGGGVVFTNSSVTSTADIRDNTGRQLFMTGALTVNLATRGRVIPYAAVGAGVVSNIGDLPSLTLTGNYRFDSVNAIPGTFPVNETDTVTVRLVSSHQRSLVTVVGGGAKFHASRRWGIRGDVRAYISRNTVDVLVDAAPHVVTSSTPLGIIASTLVPSIQFTNFPSLVTSTLSGPAIKGFKTFSSSGTSVHLTLSAGYFLRF
jgi:hypothetical protein